MKSIIILAFICFLTGCTKTSRQVPDANLMPPPFDFVLVDSVTNKPVIGNEIQSLRLWYVINGQTNYIEDLKIKSTIHSREYDNYATTLLAPLRSSDNISKTFYLQVDNNKIDTIYLDVIRLSEPVEGEYNQYNQVKFDGRIISLDLNQQPALWVFKK